MMSLNDAMPHMGFGKALFGFLYENELNNLRQTCTEIKQDVDAHVQRYGAVKPPMFLTRKNGRLFLSYKGREYDAMNNDFSTDPTPNRAPITQERYDRKLAAAEKKYGKYPHHMMQVRAELGARLRSGFYGIFYVHEPHVGGFPEVYFDNLVEFKECYYLLKELTPKIHAERTRLQREAEEKKKAVETKKPAPLKVLYRGSLDATYPWGKK